MVTIRKVQGDPTSMWYELSWTEMNSPEQKCWMALGWDEDSWKEETDPPESNYKPWEGLTDSEKTAALKLGYTQELWGMVTIREVQGDPSSVWAELSWIEMNSAEQKCWTALGWDEDSWEEETDPPESNDKYWEELTDSEKTAALELGYTQELWDEE